jgi:hypothetical protein
MASAPRASSPDRDPVLEIYKKDVDRTSIRENLKLTPDQRLRKLQDVMKSIEAIQGTARRPR